MMSLWEKNLIYLSLRFSLRHKSNNSPRSFWPLWTFYAQMMESKRTISVKLSLYLTSTLYKLAPQYKTTCLTTSLKKKWSRLSTLTSMFRTMKMVVEGANWDMSPKSRPSSEVKMPLRASAKTSSASNKWLQTHQLPWKKNRCSLVKTRASPRSLRNEMRRARPSWLINPCIRQARWAKQISKYGLWTVMLPLKNRASLQPRSSARLALKMNYSRRTTQRLYLRNWTSRMLSRLLVTQLRVKHLPICSKSNNIQWL